MRAAILAIGDELLLGQALDTNSAWLADQLVQRGVMVIEHRTMGDDREALAGAIRELAAQCDLLLITGGLGPTPDDLTRGSINDVVHPGEPLVTDETAREALRAWYDRRRRAMPAINLRQAERPRSARCLPNPRGTAPGLALVHRACAIYALPGPPAEMQPMFLQAVAPDLDPVADRAILTQSLHAYGLAEAEGAERLGDLMARNRHPLVGTTVSGGLLTARIRAAGPREQASEAIDETRALIERAWAPYVFGRDSVTLPQAVAAILLEQRATVTVAESCTGGWLGAMLADVPGISAAFVGGWITYSNEMKTAALGVAPELLRAHGAVSEQAARAMAEGALQRSGAARALSITGIAGPDGGSHAKPVGTVFIAVSRLCAAGVETSVRRFLFTGDRAAVRDRAAKAALQLLRWSLLGLSRDIPMLFQVEPLAAEASR